MKTKGETFKRNGERWQIGTTTNPMFVKKHPGESGWAVWKETIGGFWLKITMVYWRIVEKRYSI